MASPAPLKFSEMQPQNQIEPNSGRLQEKESLRIASIIHNRNPTEGEGSSNLSEKFKSAKSQSVYEDSDKRQHTSGKSYSIVGGSSEDVKQQNSNISMQSPFEVIIDDSPKQEEEKEAGDIDALKIQFDLEKGLIDMKYKQQLSVLEKKPQNALTKKLIAKVQNEWNLAIEKKRKEFEGTENK